MAKRQSKLPRSGNVSRGAVPSRMYPDLHEHLERLEREGLLIRVKEPVDKDQEMHPLVRWQFRGGIKERDRKAFLFEKLVDAKGRQFDIPVAIGAQAEIPGIHRDVQTGKFTESVLGSTQQK